MSQKITLFCSAGMSTSLLVNKMKEAASAAGKDYEIAAYSMNEAPEKGKTADVILLGPQVRFAKDKMYVSGYTNRCYRHACIWFDGR